MASPAASRNSVRLTLGEQTSLVQARGVQPAGHRLELGTLNVLPGPFRHDPPRASELEAAIEFVEDVVMPIARRLRAGATLESADALALRIAALATGADQPDSISLEAVESQFGRLAMAAQRGAWSGEAMDGPTAAYLLILREVMHHWRIERLDLVVPAAG
jgi:hypothetical protein